VTLFVKYKNFAFVFYASFLFWKLHSKFNWLKKVVCFRVPVVDGLVSTPHWLMAAHCWGVK